MNLDLFYKNFTGEAILQAEDVEGFDPVAEKELKTQKDFINGLTEALAGIYDTVEAPFYLRVYEFRNQAQYPTWETMTTNRDYDKRLKIFQSGGGKRLFTTSLHQPYFGLHSKEHRENYGGDLGVELMMFGCQSDQDKHWIVNPEAETLVCLTLIEYQKQITKFYPEWTTLYFDAPSIKSWQINNLE